MIQGYTNVSYLGYKDVPWYSILDTRIYQGIVSLIQGCTKVYYLGYLEKTGFFDSDTSKVIITNKKIPLLIFLRKIFI